MPWAVSADYATPKPRPHPEELAKQASRRMDTTQGLAAILRDARKGALLRMRSGPCSPDGAQRNPGPVSRLFPRIALRSIRATDHPSRNHFALRVILIVFGIRRRLDRGGQHRNGLILLWNIHRLVVRVVRDLLDRGFVDQGVFRNHARLGIRDVAPEQRSARLPLLVLVL